MHLASYSTKCFQVDHAATAFGRSGRLSGARRSVQVLTRAKFHGWLSDETAMRLLFKFAGEDISAHEEMARNRAERAEERKAGIIQPLPTSDLLDMQ
jgi:hypothetical protein